MLDQMKLTDALAVLSFTHHRDERSVNTGEHPVYLNGHFVGRFTAHEAWEHINGIIWG